MHAHAHTTTHNENTCTERTNHQQQILTQSVLILFQEIFHLITHIARIVLDDVCGLAQLRLLVPARIKMSYLCVFVCIIMNAYAYQSMS